MPKKLVFLVTLLALLPVAFASPVPAQEELEGGSVVVDGDIVLDCRIFFEALEEFRDDPPSDRISQRDYEEAVGYVRLCTERGVVPPFNEVGEPQNASTTSGSIGPLPASGGFSPLFALGTGGSILAALLVVGGLLARKITR